MLPATLESRDRVINKNICHLYLCMDVDECENQISMKTTMLQMVLDLTMFQLAIFLT